jgi:acetyl-CoA C-acetyltransferase
LAVVVVLVVGIEEVIKFKGEQKLKSLPGAFTKSKQNNGTVTAGNSSKISDGSCFVILVSGKFLKKNKNQIIFNNNNKLRIKDLFLIKSIDDAAKEPEEFTTAPSLAIPKALNKIGLSINQVDLFEINEAFAVVTLINAKLLKIPIDKVNVYGGACAMGHPIGCSGSRIVATLCNALSTQSKKIGAAGICNGGGGASSIVIERREVGNLFSKLSHL